MYIRQWPTTKLPSSESILKLRFLAYRELSMLIRAALVSGHLSAEINCRRCGNWQSIWVFISTRLPNLIEFWPKKAGWILKRRRGAIVLDRKQPGRPEPAKVEGFLRRLRELVAELRAAGVTPATIARELRSLAEGLEQ